MHARSTAQRLIRPRALFALLIAAALLPVVPASADHPGEHDDASAQSAQAPSGGARVRVSPNWELRPDANPIAGRDAIGLAVNPRNARHVVAVYADWATLWCETAVSFDAGRTWRRSRLKAPAGFIWPPCTVGGHLANQIDQTIAFGRGDTVYTTFASARAGASGVPEEGRSVLVARSTDGGRSFGVGQVVLAGGENADTGPDYVAPKIAVAAGARRRADRIVLAAGSSSNEPSAPAEREEAVVTVSDDGGRTWGARTVVNDRTNSIELSQPVFGRGGRVYLAWRTRSPGQRPGQFVPEGQVVVARSADNGRTWTRQAVAGVRGHVYEGPRAAPFATVQSYTASTFPRLAADRRSGAVYLVYGNGGPPTTPGRARAADHFIHPDIDVWIQRSRDGGQTWSSPDRLNDELPVPTEITQTRHPNVSVAPNGRVDVVWHDRRHWYRGCVHTHLPCLEARLGDTYYAYSDDGGRSFSPDRRLTDRSINNDVGYDYRFGTYWDYGPVAVPLGRKRLLVAWMDSRIGNVETDSQGIFLAHVTHGRRTGPTPLALRGSDPKRLAVDLSRQAYPAGPEAVLGGTFASRPWSRVVIVNERDADRALAAGVLARANIGTVLLSSAGGLDARTKAEVARLQPIGAYVVGTERALSAKVVEDLASTGIPRDQITRLVGSNRADSAKVLAEAADRRTVAERRQGRPAFDAAILVNPDSPDAFAAATLAAHRRLPILFSGRDGLPASTQQALATLAVQRVLVVGGRDDLGPGAVAGLPQPQRLGGTTPVATSVAVAVESRRRGLPSNTVFTADGLMESALLGPAAARIGGIQLLGDAGTALGAVRTMGLRLDVDRVVEVGRG